MSDTATRGEPAADTAALVGPRPSNVGELAQWVQRHLKLRIPDRAVCPGHQSPMEYLAASFLSPPRACPPDLLVWANRGGGKTMLAAVASLLEAIYLAPIRLRILGGSFDQSDRLAEYLREFLSGELSPLVRGRMTRQRITLAGPADIRMLSQSQRSVRGQHVQRIRCDEVDLFDPDVWRALQFVTRSSPVVRGGVEVFSTLHRPGGLMHRLVEQAREGKGFRLIHWCLWEVIQRCPPQRRCRQCPLADDCRGRARRADGFFPIDDAIAIQGRSSRSAWEAEMLCLGARRDYLVFAEFDPGAHVADASYQPELPLYRAIDFGYRHQFVCLWIQLAPSGGVHVIDEYAAKEVSLVRNVEQVRDRYGNRAEATYVDPSGSARETSGNEGCVAIMWAERVPCQYRRSGIVEGLELIRAALSPASGPPTLKIAPRCRGLIQAFQEYHYPPPGSAAAADRRGETPVKDGPDHFIDALRYLFVNRLRPGANVTRGRY